jgi:hypothetical protein
MMTRGEKEKKVRHPTDARSSAKVSFHFMTVCGNS